MGAYVVAALALMIWTMRDAGFALIVPAIATAAVALGFKQLREGAGARVAIPLAR